jgi:NTE family protein
MKSRKQKVKSRKQKPSTFYFLLFALFSLLSSLFTPAQAQAQPKVAVTLAGGVARGFAFLGALEVLVKEGVPVDRIVGTSAGAMVAGLYSSGYSFATLEQVFAELRLVQGDLVRVLFPPTRGLLDPSGLEVVYRALVDGQQLEQTSPPLAVMVTELRPAPPRALVSGDVAAAIRASISLPIVFPVPQIDGVYYADGGLREPFPVGVAKALGSDVVIGIRGQPDPSATPDNLFGALGVLVGALTLPIVQTQPEAWIRVKTFDALYFDFSKVPELMQRGRETARAELPSILKMLVQKGVKLNPKGDPHEKNGINQNWRMRLERGVQTARGLPRPLTVAPAVELTPSAFDWNTRPAQQGAYSSLGLGADLTGGVLGNFSLGLGYVERLNDTNDSIFVRGSFDFAPFRVYGSFDPARRPSGNAWELGFEYKAGNIWNPPFMARVSLDAMALGVSGETRFALSQTQFSAGLELRFGYAPSLRLQTHVGLETTFQPFFLRTRALLGLTTGGAEGFGFGYHSFLRGYPANFTVSRQAVIANLEVGYRLELPSVAGVISAAPEFRLFWDMGWALSFGTSSNAFLWSVGAGINLPGAWFGFLPFGVGMDFAISPVGVRLVAYTAFKF